MKNKDSFKNLNSEDIAKLLITFNPVDGCWVFPHSMNSNYPFNYGWLGSTTFPVNDYYYDDVVREVAEWLEEEAE